MIRYLKYLCVLFLLLLLNSCSVDENPNGVYSEMVNLDIKVNALDPNVKIRILIMDAESEDVLINDRDLDLSQPYRIKVKTGSLNLYIIGNEPDGLTQKLNNLRHESQILPLTLSRADIPTVESPPGSIEKSNLPLFKAIPILVKAENHDPETGMVSTDNGATWSKTVTVVLDRLAVKANLKVRKYTNPETDIIVVKKVSIKNIPAHSYWYLGQPYMRDDFLSPEFAYNDPNGVTFTTNADKGVKDNYTPIFNGYIIPEYIIAKEKETDENLAVAMEVYALYNGSEKIYHLPLQTSPKAGTFSLLRNTEHTLNVTIESKGGAIITPEVKYEVSEWDDAKNEIEIEKTIAYDAHWENTPPRDQNNIFLASDKMLEFTFKLAHPKGSTWKATLTNPLYFEFDYESNAVSAGLGGIDVERTIRIKPKKGVNTNGIKSDFYITVNIDSEYIELDLPNQTVGAGNRFVINLIPE